jgi:hypothetical protein
MSMLELESTVAATRYWTMVFVAMPGFIVVAPRESTIAMVSIAALIFLVAWAPSGLCSAGRSYQGGAASRVLRRAGDGGDGRDRRTGREGALARA